ncbi:MAG: cell division protein ZapB [Anaerostipes sp.]|uniref:cell division protein ZapB n=1 Tax=Anaerostipes sp. TaxID=1872530 RepID=UPI003992C7F4
MKANKIVRFSVQGEDCFTEIDQNIEKSQFTKVHFKFYSNKMNTHGYICDIDVLKKYAPTIAGKPILARINQYANNGQGDFAGHEYDEIAVGFFPLKGLELTYEVGNDGTLYACADGYIWNMYYEDVINILRDYGGVKGVSSEVLVIDSDIISEYEEAILQMSFTGVTLLGERNMQGRKIKPAVKGCQGKIVDFSISDMQKEFISEKTKFEKVLYSKIDESSKDGSFLMKNEKEVNMAKDPKDETVASNFDKNAKKVVEKKVGEGENKKTVVKNTEPKADDKKVGEPKTNSIDEKIEDVKNDDVEINGLKEELKAVLDKCEELQGENDRLKAENEDLTEYKNEKEKQDIKKKVDIALNNVAKVLTQKQLDDFRKRSADCSVETVDSFINEIKAFAYDVKDKKGQKQADLMRCSIPVNDDYSQKESDDVWDRISQKFN